MRPFPQARKQETWSSAIIRAWDAPGAELSSVRRGADDDKAGSGQWQGIDQAAKPA